MEEKDHHEVSRRGFLKAAAVTAAAATAAGTGAALLKPVKQPTTTTFTTSPPASPTLSVPPLSAANTESAAFGQLATAQADNMRLQAALDAANRQLTALQQHDANTMAANEGVQTELAAAANQIGVMAGLLALYEQMEGIDLDTVLADGAAAVSESISSLVEDIPAVEESLEAGRLALAEVESHLPVIENGRAWLDGHMNKLNLYFQNIERLLQEVVDAAGPLLQMINDWFVGIKKWLPFGIGETASNVMQSVTILLIETPSTISGLNTNIAEPLDVWLGRDEQNEMKLQSKLINPVRDELMAKTGHTLAKARQIETTYATQVKEPMAMAVANRQTVRELIQSYREQHQI